MKLINLIKTGETTMKNTINNKQLKKLNAFEGVDHDKA
tara:strand:+ start:292 stop:405 length:114 start_codon:yes stop_codon:yes gene_type:complete